MRKIKITADSSANVLALEKVPFASAPLKVITADQEFVDTEELDVSAMLDYFSQYKGKSKTSCPNPGATVTIGENRGLCSYYAEIGGLLVGYEKL